MNLGLAVSGLKVLNTCLRLPRNYSCLDPQQPSKSVDLIIDLLQRDIFIDTGLGGVKC